LGADDEIRNLSMESVANSPYLPPLAAPHDRKVIGEDLQRALVQLINLSLIGKQFHWSVIGPGSRAVHLYLDELVDSWRELADLVAERAAALGIAVDGQALTVAGSSWFGPVPAGPVEARIAVWEMTRRVAEVAEEVRFRLVPVGEVDLVSQGVLLDVVRTLEKQQWMLRVQLGERT
jgi:starvation-inducible DNA-binding protein